MNIRAGLRVLCLGVFLVGLVGAGVAIYNLDAVTTVLSLIVASVSGLYLLKMRAQAQGRLDRSA
ncbi:hypothetical protein [Rhodococcus tukisamuensis]|uniref:Uncharacterized protein n=1 Tax=Rhodococcus tukisamuensis TaxID=168276 RepID=A0A1G7CFU6_9NOCA|nr:hypothetical protein [Rhodococcus tukisamuensis]SDE38252.1 hypothetical protein SAMN05444580_1162 [Rhodococcus tukisamuensis]